MLEQATLEQLRFVRELCLVYVMAERHLQRRLRQVRRWIIVDQPIILGARHSK